MIENNTTTINSKQESLEDLLIIKEMMELRDKYSTSIMIVTHNLAVALYMADKIIVMKDGEVVDRGNRDKILNNPKSDYTKRLLASVPTWREERHA